MGVIGVYTPANNFRIRTIFLGDSTFDTNVKRGSTFWEFQNANYYHALVFSDYKLSYVVETNAGGGVWQRKQLDVNLYGVGIQSYCYYKNAVSPITIDSVWDYNNQQLRIYVDCYLLWTMTQQNPINIIAINQAMTLSQGLEPVYDSFGTGSITVTYTATNLPNSTTPDPTPKVLIKKDYHPNAIINGTALNLTALPDILTQIQAWPNTKADPSANYWIGVVFNVEFLGGSTGGSVIPPAVINKALAVQMALTQKLRYEIRVIHGNLQTFNDNDYPNPNSLDRALIALANANPQVPASYATALAQIIVPQSLPQPPNLTNLPYGTPNNVLDGIRDTYYQQVLKLLSLMTRPINFHVEDDEHLTHMISSPVTSFQKSVQYVTWMNYMLGKMRQQLPPFVQSYLYDIFDLWRAVNTADLQIGTIVQVNTTGKASMSMYPYYAEYTWKQISNKRGLYIALKSKISEKLAGINRNDYFVTAGIDKEELIVRPGPYLGFLKGLEVLGNDKFNQGYFTPFQGVFQKENHYAWQFWATSAVKAVCSRPDIRAILDNGTLCDGDVLEFPSNTASQKMFLFDCGNKLVLILAKKWAGEYVIWAYYVRPSNYDYQDKEKTVTFNLEGNDVTVTARWQGSLYKRDLAGNLEHFDDWHEESEWNWWNQSIIITNNGNDMAGINDMGNGIGFLYQVAKDGTTILSTEFNNVDGMRTMRDLAVIDAPMAFNRASTGIIHITSVAGAGTIDDVQVDGNSLLAGPYSVGTSNPTTEAEGLAAAINAYTPISGYVYKAFNVNGDVYLLSPIDVGSVTNGLDITVIVSTNTIVTSTEAFHNGNTAGNSNFDATSGRRYFLNADYNSQGVPDTIPAVRTSLLYAIEITRYVNIKGLQGGMPTKSFTIINDAIVNTLRCAVMEQYLLNPASGTADVLAYIVPDGYVDGDLIFLKNEVAANTIIIESAPVTTSPSPYKNIYLANNTAATLTERKAVLVLQYNYDALLGGGIFVELYRQFSSTGDCEFWVGSYTQAQALAASDGLIPCNVYQINDRGDNGITLRAATVNTFEKHATYHAAYGASGQIPSDRLEQCEYDFENDKVNWRYEDGIVDPGGLDGGPYIRANRVRNDYYNINAYFKFGYVAWYSNYVENTLFVIDGGVDVSTLVVQTNVLIESTAIQINGDGVSVNNNNILQSGGNVVLAGGAQFYGNFLSFGGGVQLGSGAVLSNCRFERSVGITIGAGIIVDKCSFLNMGNYLDNMPALSENYSNKIIEDRISTFDATINPSAAMYIVMGASAICGIVNIASIAAASHIGAILSSTTGGSEYDLLYHNIKLKPESGITCVIDDVSVATSAIKNIYLDAIPGANLTLNGSKGDWAEFEYDNDIASPRYQTWSLVNYFNGI